jgi:hypothetical protein
MAANTILDDAKAAAKAAADVAAKAAADADAKARAAKDAADKSKAASDAATEAAAKATEDPTNAEAKNAADAAAKTAAAEAAAAKAAADAADAANRLAADAAAKATEAQKLADSGAESEAGGAANGQPEKGPTATNAVPPMAVAASTSTSYYDLLKAVVSDPKLTGPEKKEIVDHLKGISPTSDRLTYRTAICILGLIAIVTIAAIWNIAKGTTVPDGLIAIASGAVGGLAGLLSPSRSSDPHSP